jgi:hypothetical protein
VVVGREEKRVDGRRGWAREGRRDGQEREGRMDKRGKERGRIGKRGTVCPALQHPFAHPSILLPLVHLGLMRRLGE